MTDVRETAVAPAETASPVPAVPPASGGAAPARLLWLDVAKGLAILWVVLFHVRGSVERAVASGAALAAGWADAVAALGSRASQSLTVFVAASGFVLVYAALGRPRPPAGQMRSGRLLRRLARLLSVYWFAHLVMFVAFLMDGRPMAGAGPLLWLASLLGLNALVPGWFAGVRDTWWFMGLILQLSLLSPLLLWAFRRLPPWRFLALAWLLTVVSRLVCARFLYEWNPYLQYGAFSGCRIFEFALGMAAAGYLLRRQTPVRPLVAALAGAAALAAYVLTGAGGRWLGPYVLEPTIASVCLCVLAWVVAGAVSRVRHLGAALAWCGGMTLPIFLMHDLKPDVLIRALIGVGIDSIGLVTLILVVAAVAEGACFWLLYLAASRSLRFALARAAGLLPSPSPRA